MDKKNNVSVHLIALRIEKGLERFEGMHPGNLAHPDFLILRLADGVRLANLSAGG